MKAWDESGNQRNAQDSVGNKSENGALSSGQFQPIPAAHDARHIRELAIAYLEPASAGEPSEALAVALAAAVAAGEQFRLALAVFAGGPHIHARATELAASVLSTTLAADARPLNRKREA